MVRGLRDEYCQIILNFRNGHRKFDTEDLDSVTAWCKNFDEDTSILTENPLPLPMLPAHMLESLGHPPMIPLGKI